LSSDPPKRLQSRVPVQLKVVFQDVGEVLEAFSTNLGAGGMLLNTDRDLDTGYRLRLRFQLPGIKEEFNTGAEVAWRRKDLGGGTGVGLRFTDLSPEDRGRIARFVTERWSQLARSAVLAASTDLLHECLGGPLAQRGIRVLSARDGVEVMTLLEDLRGIGVILLDLLLPPQDGLHVLQALRSRPTLLARQIPVILLIDGQVSPLEMDQLRSQGATAVLTYGKSADWNGLADAALTFVGRPAQAPG
jgi:uncharacterized protein (TIGR02266 family)